MRSTLFVCLACLLAVGCQRRGDPIQLPTQDQVRRIQESILDEAPEIAVPVGAVFDNRFRLIGWEVEPASVEVGTEFALTLFWEVLEETDERWQIFVHLDVGGQRQNLDHEAIDGGYPTQRWRQGDIIRDRVPATLETHMPPGNVEVFLGFWKGEDRLPVSDPGSGQVMDDGRLRVGSFPGTWEPPRLEIRRATSPVRLDGRGTDRAWSRAQRTPAWSHPSTGERVEGGDAWAKMLWDDTYLYVLMHARDPDVWATFTERDANLWDEEVLEFYFDGSGEGQNYLELQVNPLGTIFDAVFPRPDNRDLDAARSINLEGLEVAAHVSGTTDDRSDADRSWSVEVRVPLTSLPGLAPTPPGDGDEVRLNFYRYDRPADQDGPTTAAWSPVGPGSFHNPPRFGVGVFRGEAGGGTPGTPAEGSGEADDSEQAGSDEEVDDDSAGGVRLDPSAIQRVRPGPRTRPRGL